MGGRDEKAWDLVSRSGQNNDTDCATQVAPAGWRCDSRPSGQVPASRERAEAGRLSRLLSPERVYKKREVGLMMGKAAWGGEGVQEARLSGPSPTMETLGQTRELEHCLGVSRGFK